MDGLTLSLRAADRSRAIRLTLIALAAIFLFSIWTPAAAHASGCTVSWSAKGSGSWFNPANWSTKAVPVAADEVCITESGSSYTVEMNQTAAVTVKALTVGGAANTQTLSVGSTTSAHAVLTTTEGITNGAHGAIVMTNGDAAANNVTIVGPVSNAGTLTSEPAHGGQRFLEGNLTNTGTLAVNVTTRFVGSKALLSNEGALKVATGTQLVVSNEGSVTNGSGGSIAGTGSGTVAIEPGSAFTEGAGTTSGSKPVIVRDAALHYTGAGSSAVAVHGAGSTLSGNVSAGQSISIECTGSEHAYLTASANFSSAGTITLTSFEAANQAALIISAGTLTNSGSINVEPGVGGGARFLEGNITNTGTIAVNTTTKYDASKALLNNEGALKVAEGTQLIVSNEGSVTNGTGGSIAGTGSGNMAIEPGTAFTEGAGTTTGSKPVIVRDAALHYTGSGSSAIAVHGAGSTLSGNVAAGQSITIECIGAEHAYLTASANFSNAGTITLTSAEAANQAALILSAGTLTNSGSINVEPGVGGGARFLEGNITNTGTIAVNTATKYDVKALLTNEGAIKLAKGVQLTVSGGASVTNASGSITGTEGGGVLVTAGTFTEGAGTTSGTQPVIVDNGTVAYTGSGASLIRSRGVTTLTGNLSAGQTLSVESTISENAETKASASFTNAGTIVLTNGDAAANFAALEVLAGTLTNSGTISSEAAAGGARYLQGNVTNTGTLAINATTKYDLSSTTLLNNGAINIANGVTLLAPTKQTINNETGGTIAATGTGTLAQTSGTFNQGLGTTSGTQPVVLDDGALHYTGTGMGTIALRGSSTLSGNIAAGQTLSIQSSVSEHAFITAAASFTSSGTLVLTNGDTAGNEAVLILPSKATLTNKATGTINVENPHGGVRAIEGSLKNEGLLSLAAGETLKVTGTYVQTGGGTLKTAIAGTSTFGALAVTSTAKLAGALAVVENEPFIGKAGETFAILSSSKATGTFSDLDNVVTKTPGRYYVPSYSPTGVTITDTQATLTATPSEGKAGSKVTLKGTGYQPKDKVKLTFVDAKKAKTTLTTVTIGPSGEFSVEVTLSSKAAKGSGTFGAESSSITGLVVTTAFTVT